MKGTQTAIEAKSATNRTGRYFSLKHLPVFRFYEYLRLYNGCQSVLYKAVSAVYTDLLSILFLEEISDLGEKELFLSRLRRCSSFLFLLLLADGHELVHELDHEEDAERHDKEVDDSCDEMTVVKAERSHSLGIEALVVDPRELDLSGDLSASDRSDERIDEIVSECGDDVAERSADDNADSHVHDIALECEFFEFLDKLLQL